VLIRNFLAYPLEETLASEDAKPFMEDNLKEVVEAIVMAADSGDLEAAVKGGHDAFKVTHINTVIGGAHVLIERLHQ
jgi:hypothetical protein